MSTIGVITYWINDTQCHQLIGYNINDIQYHQYTSYNITYVITIGSVTLEGWLIDVSLGYLSLI